jgi:hypothetical protein
MENKIYGHLKEDCIVKTGEILGHEGQVVDDKWLDTLSPGIKFDIIPISDNL